MPDPHRRYLPHRRYAYLIALTPASLSTVQRTGDVALAGAPNVGKSSLLNALIGEHLAIVSPKAQATRLPVVGLRTEHETQFVFHDLPGLLEPAYLLQQRMRAVSRSGLKCAPPRRRATMHA